MCRRFSFTFHVHRGGTDPQACATFYDASTGLNAGAPTYRRPERDLPQTQARNTRRDARNTNVTFTEITGRSNFLLMPDGTQQLSPAPNDPQPPSFERMLAPATRRVLVIAALATVFALFVGSGTARAAWIEISEFLSLSGKPVPSSAAVLSEHEIEALDGMSPQSQADLLLERSINHFRGANEQIERRVGGWRGKIKLDDRLNNLFVTALNSDDLRVRAAAIEVDIAARDLGKTLTTIDLLEHDARLGEQGPRANALWDIALLGNRGIAPERAFEILAGSLHDSNVNVRYWAVEGLSYLGTDQTITPLLQVLHDDPSPMIRERAACGLAQSGMLSERQRRAAVPRLLDFSDDPSLDPETRKWVFQALRDITGQDLPHDPAAWRSWYSTSDGNWKPVTRDGD